MDPVDGLARTFDSMERLLSSLDADDLKKPTPCTEWNVRDVLNHALGAVEVFTAVVRDGAQFQPIDMSVDHVGDEPAATVRRLGDASLAAWREPGAADKPTGMIPGVSMLELQLGDLTVHTWDVAQGVGRDPELPADVVEHLLTKMEAGWAEAGAQFGAFGPPCEPAAGASALDRLAAITGRQPA